MGFLGALRGIWDYVVIFRAAASVFFFLGIPGGLGSGAAFLSLGISMAVFTTPLGPYENVLGSVDAVSTGGAGAGLDPIHIIEFPVIGGLGLHQEHFVSVVTYSYAIL